MPKLTPYISLDTRLTCFPCWQMTKANPEAKGKCSCQCTTNTQPRSHCEIRHATLAFHSRAGSPSLAPPLSHDSVEFCPLPMANAATLCLVPGAWCLISNSVNCEWSAAWPSRLNLTPEPQTSASRLRFHMLYVGCLAFCLWVTKANPM